MDALKTYLQTQKLSQAQLAARLGIKQPSLHKWLKTGRIPPRRVRDVEAITGIPASKLCPELFGRKRS